MARILLEAALEQASAGEGFYHDYKYYLSISDWVVTGAAKWSEACLAGVDWKEEYNWFK
jgi:hypothetical protein